MLKRGFYGKNYINFSPSNIASKVFWKILIKRLKNLADLFIFKQVRGNDVPFKVGTEY